MDKVAEAADRLSLVAKNLADAMRELDYKSPAYLTLEDVRDNVINCGHRLLALRVDRKEE